MSWNLSPQDLLDAQYLPSLWTTQKVALLALLDAVRGRFTIERLVNASKASHRALANARRKRKPQVKYTRTSLS